jgi:hypothetical protein
MGFLLVMVILGALGLASYIWVGLAEHELRRARQRR